MNEQQTGPEKYMLRCLQLASCGRGFVSPNPLVGAVVVCRGKIIGEGFHRRYGEAHAEVNAIASVRDRSLLRESTLYVNLEPCSHYGKTPPCAELIIKEKIPRVVVGMEDPFPAVAGRGIGMLREAGLDILCGVMETECRALNRRFITAIEKRRPYILLKWAQSADGFLDRFRLPDGEGRAVRFSNSLTRMQVHKMRAEEDAIMVGKNTELLDHPRLTVRYWEGRDPLKVAADSRIPLREQLCRLAERGVHSLIVEGGAALLQSFIAENLWDEARVEVAVAIELKEGVKAPHLPLTPVEAFNCENYVLFYNNPHHNS